MNNHKNQGAFTLVELLLVVTIIGILAGAVLVNFSGQSQRAKITRANADIANISLALDTYELTIGAYPTTEEGLNALVEDPGVDGWRPFLTRKTFNDPWGNEYRFRIPGTRGINFDLFSIGPDGQEGTEDDIGNWDEENF
ncbi:MAG: type II secretion system protein GspG [Candidatus Omnitrophota bacterium]|jgi:general secretion pathway protein G|nr:MAG: type II secretion system protein GspG [Candidatus Omnitrophota bacterium]